MRSLLRIIGFIIVLLSAHGSLVPVSAQTDWPMTAANPQRTSHNSVEVPGNLNPVWYRPINPYIDNKVQVIAADNKVFVSSSKGLYAFDAGNGNQLWVYGTELPLGNSPTFFNGTLYVGGYDHKIHAVNASNGQLKTGWTFVNAEAGFDTNPLVISDTYTNNQPVVVAGNRDGYLYALDGNTGSLKWKFSAGSPLHYSAAYKNGVVYFGSDDNYAYAVNIGSGTQVWKTGKFPGIGFDMYWPVIYTDTQSGKDYVIFTGSLKSSWMWFVGNMDTSHQPNVDMFSGSSGCPTINNVPYYWPSGTTVLDCSRITNYYQNHPAHRFTFILDRTTGAELTNPYAPFNPSPHDGGGQGYRQPPVVGNDNILYTFVGYIAGGNGGAVNGVVGWKFGTPYISRVVNESSTGTDGASDEPRTLTSGGNYVYYGEGFNHQIWGSMEVSKPLGSNNWYKWDTRGVAGATTKYTQITLEGKFGGQNGSYSYFDGLQNLSPIPYNGKLYYIQGNILFAMASGTGTNTPLSTAATPANQSGANLVTTKTMLTQKLEAEVQKIIDVYTQTGKILRPGFHDSHHINGSMILGAAFAPYYIPGEHLSDYFHNPADTINTLAGALPYLSPSLQDQVKTYLQNNFGPNKTYNVSTIAHIGWNSGAKREAGDDTPEMTATLNNSNGLSFYLALTPQTSIIGQNERLKVGTFPPENFYGAYRYAQVFPAQAKTLFDTMKSKLPTPGVNNDLGYASVNDSNSNFAKYPYILNLYLTGYRGYLELEKLASYTTDITQSDKYGIYNELLQLKVNTFTEASRWTEDDIFINVFNTAGNFMFLSPEIDAYLRTSNKASQIQQTLANSLVLEPYWFVSKYNRSFSESYARPLYDYPALFQARTHILQQPFSELVKYIDVPAFERGDLFYIQNLVAVLEAPGDITPPPVSPTGQVPLTGDLDNDNDVDLLDLLKLLGVFSTSSPVFGDFNLNGRIDIFDLNTLIHNL